MRPMDAESHHEERPEEPIGIDRDPTDDDDMQIIDAYLVWLAGKPVHASADTLNLRRKILRRLDTELPFGLTQVATEDLHAWLYRGGWAPNTLATYYRAIKSFYTWATNPRLMGGAWLDERAMEAVDGLERAEGVPGVARPVTDEQLRIVLTTAAEPYRTWATIAAYNGLRCCEIAGLDREHITAAKLVVVRGKGGKPREHATDPYVWAAVRDLPPGPIARKVTTGRRESAINVGHRASRHFRQVLGVDVTMHQFRHWLGCSVLDATDNMRKAQVMLGHRQITSTEIYTRVTLDQQRQTQAAIPRLAG